MAVIVDCMEMPKSCEECPLFDWDLDYIKCKVTNKHFLISEKWRDERSETCPLMSVEFTGGDENADSD